LAYNNFDIAIHKDKQSLIATLRGNGDVDVRALERISFDIKEIRDEMKKITQADSTHFRLGKRIYASIFHASGQTWTDEDVLPGDTLHLRLAVAQAISRQKKERLRLIFRTSSDSMPDTPIEFLCYRDSENPPGVFLALNPQWSLVRMPLADTSFGKTTIPFPLRILVVISRGALDDDFNVEEEKKSLQEIFADLNFVSVDFLGTENDPEATWPEVRARVQGIGVPPQSGFPGFYSVFHFIGHGSFDQNQRMAEGSIRLKDSAVPGSMQAVPGSILARSFALQKTVRAVILQSCETATTDDVSAFHGVAQQIVSNSVPCVVGMQSKISAKAARKFMKVFYSNWLDERLPLEAAVAMARADLYDQARLEKGIEPTAWASPVVFLTSEIEMTGSEEPVLPPEKQKLADKEHARITDYERLIEEADAKLLQPLMPDDKATFTAARAFLAQQLEQAEKSLGQVLRTYVNISNGYASPGTKDPVAVPLLLSVQDSKPTRLEFQLRFNNELVEFDSIVSKQGNGTNSKPFSPGVVLITVDNQGREIIRDKEEISTLFFRLKSTAKSVILRAGKIKILQGEEQISTWGSPGWILIKDEPTPVPEPANSEAPKESPNNQPPG